MSDPAESQPEQLLTSWLVESDEAQGKETLSRLIVVHAEPAVRRIVGFKLAGGSYHRNNARADVDDVCNEALRNLLSRLDSLKARAQQTPLRDFNSYVAVTAFNACNEYFRKKSPARYRLGNKLRYLLTHSTQLALWEWSDGRDVAGTASMCGREPKTTTTPSQLAAQMTPGAASERLIDTVFAVFRSVNAPLLFETLLETVAQCTGLQETQTDWSATKSDGPARAWEKIPDTGPSVENGLVGREYITRLWAEIRDLPLQQRGALLLNLKDSAGGDIQLFDWLGIATIQQIGQALEMEPERFALLWKDLPLDDARVALELGIDRQDVINRRSSARKRLVNRMKEYQRGK